VLNIYSGGKKMKNFIIALGAFSIFIAGCETHAYYEAEQPYRGTVVTYVETEPALEAYVVPSPVVCIEPEPNDWAPMYCSDDMWGTCCTWAEDSYIPVGMILCDVTYCNDYDTCGWYFWDQACVVDEWE